MRQTLLQKRLSRALRVASVCVAGCLFIYQVSIEVARYVSHYTTTTVDLSRPATLQFPQVVLCPEQPFSPVGLKNLGLEIDQSNSDPTLRGDAFILQNILELKGLNSSMSAAEVWEEASLSLGEVVQSFRFGDVAENYTEDTQESHYWRRVIMPFGNCFALNLPPMRNEGDDLPKVYVILKKYPYKTECPISSQKCRYHDGPTFEECNSTCALEEFMFSSMTYKVFVSRNYSQESSGSRVLFDPSSEEVWQVSKLGEERHPLNVLTINSSLAEVHPISCPDSVEGVGFSFGSCFRERMEREYSCLPIYNNADATLGEACTFQVLHDAILNSEDRSCGQHRLQKCPYKQWIHQVNSGLTNEGLSFYKIEMALTSPKVRVEYEVDLYPFQQLASDIGGSLGLCLGMSLLTIWRWILLPKTEHPRSAGYHCRHLLYWAVVTLLTFLTALHGLESLQEYFHQSPFTAVTPSSSTGDVEGDLIDNQVAARLASRALDCRPGPYSPWEECVLDCMMESASSQVGLVAPFVDIKDLPPCQASYSWEPSNTYIVPSLAMVTATDRLLVERCRRQCGYLGALNASEMTSPEGLFVDHRFYRLKPYDILCSLGGIVSLYAGLFLSSIIPAIVNLLPDGSSNSRALRKCLTFLLASFIYVGGASLAVFLVHRFFFAHPVSSSSASQYLRVVDQPVLTACHFPVFSKPLDENSTLPLDQQWAEAAWDERISRVAITQEVGTVASGEESFNVSFVVTPLNRCSSVASSIPYNNFVTALYYWWDDDDRVLFSIHHQKDPPFASNLFTLRSYQSVVLTVTPVHYTRFGQLEGGGETYDTCLYRCVQDGYSEDVGCRLPYLDWRPDLPLCDSATAREHPSWPESLPEDPASEKRNSTCHGKCRHLLREFFLASEHRESWIEAGINIIQRRGSYNDIREDDWYELSQLGNDLGVVAGFTFGTSILSLLQTVVQRLVP